MLFSLLKHYLELYITDTALKVSRSLYFLTTSIFHGVETYFPRLWGMGIFDAILINLIMNSPSKSCSLDPWPTFLVLDYLDILIIPITSIITASLEEGKCPNFFKQAHVTPILKKSSLDKEVFKNYRPVSNLNFISKILERVVAVQLQTRLDEAGLRTAIQSAYRKHHTTESALLNIHNIILLNMAKGFVTALTLLNLSIAFDTIDHTILLDRLNAYYGISELALGWFKSYLSGRTHSVKVGNTLASCCAPVCGPPGSVLGPILFFSLH